MSRIYQLKTNCRTLHADPSKPLSLPAQQLIPLQRHWDSLIQIFMDDYHQAFLNKLCLFSIKITQGAQKSCQVNVPNVHNIYIKESKESLFKIKIRYWDHQHVHLISIKPKTRQTKNVTVQHLIVFRYRYMYLDF